MAEPSGLIPVGQAARLLMISEERIRQLVKQGYVPKSERRGYVQLVGSVQGYLRYLRDDERRSAKSAADSRVRDARALEIELRIAERTRDLIPIEDALPPNRSKPHFRPKGGAVVPAGSSTHGLSCLRHHGDLRQKFHLSRASSMP